jgi:hypothetical protein
MPTFQIRGEEHPTAHEALVERNFTGDRVISLGGQVFTVNESEFRRLQNQGLHPTTLHYQNRQAASSAYPASTEETRQAPGVAGQGEAGPGMAGRG